MGNVGSSSPRVTGYVDDSSLMDVAQDVVFDGHQATVSHPPYQNTVLFTSQIPTSPLTMYDERKRTRKHESMQISVPEEYYSRKKQIPTMIMWTHGGITVAVMGSWDNWTKKEVLEKTGDDFVTVKLLHSGVYHYRFIVNGRWAHDVQLPWAKDDMGNVCNILDVQDYVPEATESRSVLESPPSPDSSYDNTLDGTFYAKEPPLLPTILHTTILNNSHSATHTSLPRPPHVVLDHLYIQETRENPPVMAIGSTQRFRGKYVTVELYRPSRKPYQ